jgi:hypothetical protein
MGIAVGVPEGCGMTANDLAAHILETLIFLEK